MTASPVLRERSETDAEVEVQRRADRLCRAPGRSGHAARGYLPTARRQRSDVLCLEEEIRAPGRHRAASPAIVGGRKQPPEAAGGGPDARHTHARGGVEKKGLRPVRRRELAGWFC